MRLLLVSNVLSVYHQTGRYMDCDPLAIQRLVRSFSYL